MFINKSAQALILILSITLLPSIASAESNADYTHTPLFMSNTVAPNVMILLDNSGSMNDMAYKTAYNPATTYYGYFLATSNYSYNTVTSKFTINSGGTWSGNFLNWATMRKIDIARKVLVGGKASSRAGDSVTTNVGEAASSGWSVYKWGNSADASSLAPYVGTKYAYVLYTGSLRIWDSSVGYIDTFKIEVDKDPVAESGDFLNGNLAGIMQKVATKARWGLSFFNSTGQGSGEGGSTKDGSYVSSSITGSGYSSTFVSNIESTPADSWTPLAESLYQIAGYFAQDSSIRYNTANYTTSTVGNDPLWYSSESSYVSCAKNYVIIVTDGASTMDSNIPTTAPIGSGNLQDYDGDGNDSTPTSGSYYTSDFLDDVALWAHTQDLRSDVSNSQTLTIYTVYAFGNDANAVTLLKDTAKNGGFIDSDGDGTPANSGGGNGEWDANGDGIPDTYYSATDGAALETQLTSAISDILSRSSSGTALSVLGTSASGAGNVYQAYFLPSQTIVDSSGSRDIEWLGHLMSLTVDSRGSLRDSTNTCIAFNFNTALNETFVQTLSQDTAGICTTTVTSEVTLSSWSNYNWDAGASLATRIYTTRNIYGFKDANGNGVADSGEVDKLSNMFSNWKYFGVADTATATDMVNFVLGGNVTGKRDRTDANGDEWKLGDIIHSTPTVVAGPLESYGLLYGDSTYFEFLAKQKSRSTMIYVGANDGQLHAFTGSTGYENWSLVPYNLLPHLRWLPETTYSHVDYMDAKTKATDIQTFNCDINHVGTNANSGKCWGTILIAGMRMGGGEISDSGFDIDGNGDSPSTNQRKFTSSYTAIDITDASATSPTVLWEFGHNLETRFPTLVTGRNELGFSLTYPTVVKVGSSWFAVFGSGSAAAYLPDYQGDTTQTGKVFVVNIATGDLVQVFTLSDINSQFSDPITVDLDFSSSDSVVGAGYTTYNADVVYIGETYKSGSNYNGRMWRIVTNDDPNPANWSMSLLFNTATGESITAAPSTTNDDLNNAWLYFGTGKYYSTADRSDTSTYTMYGIKDPCWNGATKAWDTACLGSASSVTSASYNSPSVANSTSTLMDTTNAVVNTSGAVSGVTGGGGTAPTTFDELITLSTTAGGWFFHFPDAGERALNKPTIIGGLVLFTSFTPSADICGFAGKSFFYSVYYKTGTAFNKSTIGTTTSPATVLRRSTTSKTGLGSAIAIHSGQESGTKAYVQYSTGEASAVDFTSAINIKSGVISWKDIR